MAEWVHKVGLAICTLNRSSDLLATLRGLEKQRCAFPWEILVVDNGSEDGSVWKPRRNSRGTAAFPFV